MALILRNTKTFEIIRTHNKERELGEFNPQGHIEGKSVRGK